MERVSVIEGEMPVVLVAPHGPDDENTDYITEKAAEMIGAYAVINRGWKRDDAVDCDKDRANCNNVVHLQEEVVRDEFLNPIIRYVNRIQRDLMTDATIVLVHGMTNKINMANVDDVDVVVGYGANKLTHEHSCDPLRKDVFLYLAQKHGMMVYTGRAGGKYAGARKNNLNQYFRQWEMNPNVHSIQLEYTKNMRMDKATCDYTAMLLGTVLNDYQNAFDRADLDEDFDPKWKKIAAACKSF